jgi:cohesin loading factor subunit SCC2
LQSARELTAATWGQELATALKLVNVSIVDPEDEEFSSKVDRQNVLSLGGKIKNALREIWKDHATDVFDIGFVCRPIFYIDISTSSIPQLAGGCRAR